MFEAQAMRRLRCNRAIAGEFGGLQKGTVAVVLDKLLSCRKNELQGRTVPDVDPGVDFFPIDLGKVEQLAVKRHTVKIHVRCLLVGAALEDADAAALPVLDMHGASEKVLSGEHGSVECHRHGEEFRGIAELSRQSLFVNFRDEEGNGGARLALDGLDRDLFFASPGCRRDGDLPTRRSAGGSGFDRRVPSGEAEHAHPCGVFAARDALGPAGCT